MLQQEINVQKDFARKAVGYHNGNRSRRDRDSQYLLREIALVAEAGRNAPFFLGLDLNPSGCWLVVKTQTSWDSVGWDFKIISYSLAMT